MASNTTGDPAGAESPDAAPQPENFPIIETPDDGDPLVADSVFEMGVAPANHIAFLKLPVARASAWEEALRRYRDARGKNRFIIDHWGLPRGEYLDWRERFGRRTDWSFLAGSTGSVREWDLNQSGAGSNITANNPGSGFANVRPYLRFEIDNATSNIGSMKLAPDANTMIWSVDMLAELDYIFMPVDSNAATTWVHGVCGQSEAINTINNGAFFISAAGGNWHARTISGGVQTDTDTGIAATAATEHHFLAVMVGSAINDNSASHCFFFIDGFLVANHTANLPMGAQVHPIWGGFTSGAGGGTRVANLGPPHWVQATRFATPTL